MRGSSACARMPSKYRPFASSMPTRRDSDPCGDHSASQAVGYAERCRLSRCLNTRLTSCVYPRATATQAKLCTAIPRNVVTLSGALLNRCAR